METGQLEIGKFLDKNFYHHLPMMTDRMYPLQLSTLIKRIDKEYEEQGTIFGLTKSLFFHPEGFSELGSYRFNHYLETPIGVAAGPHTQMAQNIVTAWLGGARYIELKTVQNLDELEIARPCIDAADEGFNCEWSQELKIEQSFEEYLKAWILIHYLQYKLKHPRSKKGAGAGAGEGEVGTIFNLSVGYNMEGILKESVQKFLNKMQSCPEDLERLLGEAEKVCPAIRKINISSKVSNNITLSTMHGCPPSEIEKIAKYLLEEKKLHTTVKLNPTLNGPKETRDILNQLGYHDIIVPDAAFDHDLKFKDGVQLIGRLQKVADKNKLHFGVKLTNTLEVLNTRNRFDKKKSEMMYMSGRGLHALSISLAKKLQTEFKGNLNISFSGGADALNTPSLLSLGLYPVTVCTDLLKPGGYGRLLQYSENIKSELKLLKSKTIEDLPFKKSKLKVKNSAILKNMATYFSELMGDERYFKKLSSHSFKQLRPLEDVDCIKAPCVSTCANHQPVPDYLYDTVKGNYKEGLDKIRESNPLPNTTGMACDHLCESTCTRVHYDNPVYIRDIKRFLSSKERKVEDGLPEESGDRSVNQKDRLQSKVKIAIIGGGPSGLSAAYYLAYQGFSVDLFELKKIVGGMITSALPDFRTIKERVDHDIERIKAFGVNFIEGNPIQSEEDFVNLRKKYNYIYTSIGAPMGRPLKIPGEDRGVLIRGVFQFLDFLEEVKERKLKRLPRNVTIIGGGNSAIDAARSAMRLIPKGGKITLLYRRTENEMPADREEIQFLKEEKIKIVELVSPVQVLFEEKSKGTSKGSVGAKSDKVIGLKCVKMEFINKNEERREVKAIKDSEFVFKTNLIINATGQEAASPFWPKEIEVSNQGYIKVNSESGETTLANVFAGGDCVRGPSSIIKAIADGQKAAKEISKRERVKWTFSEKSSPFGKRDISLDEIRAKRGYKVYSPPLPTIPDERRGSFDVVVKTLSEKAAKLEADRCLYCDEVCDVCVTVCPNRANISYEIAPSKMTNKAHLLSDFHFEKGELKKQEREAYPFKIEQPHQVANVGDLCNECGNCTTFCPTSGSPYLDKPKIYISKQAFEDTKKLMKVKRSFTSFLIHPKESGFLYFDKSGKEFTVQIKKSISIHYSEGEQGLELELSLKDFSFISYKVLGKTPESINLKFISKDFVKAFHLYQGTNFITSH